MAEDGITPLPLEVGVGFWSMQSTYMRPKRPSALYREAIKEAELAEELGFETLWMGEHHLSYDGYCPSVLPAAAMFLARTQTLRVATGVLVLPFHPTRRVSEGAAALDSIAPGRFRLAMGIGYRDVEFAAAGLEVSDRARLMDERLAELRTAEQSERMGQGDLWIGTGVADGVARAARHGCSVLLMPTVTSRRIAELRAVWEENMVPHAGPTPRFGLMREVWVDSDAEQVAWARGRLAEMWRHYSNFWLDDPLEHRARRDELAEQMAGQGLFGEASEVLDRLGRFTAAGIDTLALRVRFDGVSGPSLDRCLEQLATAVLPALKSS